MKFRAQFETQEERQQLIEERSDLRLIMEENIIDGNFLTFTDEPEPAPVEPPRPMIVMTEQEYLALVGKS